MKRWNLIIDIERCNGCFNCFLAAKDEYVGNEFAGYSAAQPLHGHRWIDVQVHERGTAPAMDLTYVPVTCNHCDRAPCVEAGQGCVQKRDDGIVIIDPVRAKGRKDLVGSCPYGAIWWNEEQQLPQHWTFDAHLLDQGWTQPRCAQVCGTGAITALNVHDSEMKSLALRENLKVMHPEFSTQPRVYYRNLDRVMTSLVAGTVVANHDGVVDVVADARVELLRGDRSLSVAATDAFGEFRLEISSDEAGEVECVISAKDMCPLREIFRIKGRFHNIGIVELRRLQRGII
jgi:Fe-S-cluster-containing dehydrogenase component